MIIDSIYEPFVSHLKIENANKRAKEIRKFLSQLRSHIVKKGIGVVVTTQAGRVIDRDGMEQELMLGGEGIKYVSDLKIMIQFAEAERRTEATTNRRFFIIDRLNRYAFSIDGRGRMKALP